MAIVTAEDAVLSRPSGRGEPEISNARSLAAGVLAVNAAIQHSYIEQWPTHFLRIGEHQHAG